jgi:hypothetical protein
MKALCHVLYKKSLGREKTMLKARCIPIMLSFFCVFAAGCGSSGGSSATTNPPANNPTNPPTTPGAVTCTLIAQDSLGAPRTTYAVGEVITLVVRFENNTTTDATFVVNDGCGLSNHLIDDKFGVQASPLFDRLQGVFCTSNIVTTVISSGQSLELPFMWNQTDSNGNAVREGNYLFKAAIRDTGNFPDPTALDLAIGGNKVRVSGTATNNGIIASRALVSVGTVDVNVSQNTGQTALSTATAIAAVIDASPDFTATAVDLGNNLAEITVDLSAGNPNPYLPVAFNVSSNDPGQKVGTP